MISTWLACSMIRPFFLCERSAPTASSLRKQCESRYDDESLLRRRQLLRREAAVERLALGRHFDQEFRRGEARAVFGLKLVAKLDELPGAHEVDVGQRAAGERRKAKTQDRADIGFAGIGDHVILHGTRGLHRLHHQKALLQLLDVERIRVEMFWLQAAQFRPQALLALALLGIIIKSLAVLAAEAALLFDHLDQKLLLALV